MSYERPDRRQFAVGIFDFGGGADETFAIQGPKGKDIILRDYGVFGVTEVFNGGTKHPEMSIGSISDADAYGEEFNFGALADNKGKSVLSTYSEANEWGKVDDYILNSGRIAADTEVVMKAVAATGSGLTGMAVPFVVLDFQW